MNSKINKILNEHGYENLINFLSDELTESQLNSLLLEVFKNKAQAKSASKVLKDFIENRFSKPSTIDPVESIEIELQILKLIKSNGYDLIECSPLTPLGTSAVNKTVNQNNVVSALRRSEVVSDITNVLAIEVAKRVMENVAIDKIELAASHRLVRAQGYDNPDYTAHFKVIGMVSSWIDKGKYTAEQETLIKQIKIYIELLKDVYSVNVDDLKLELKVLSYKEDKDFKRLINAVENCVESLETNVISIADEINSYYQNLRFGIQLKSMNVQLIDGGFVNWVSNFTQNKKRKLLISGIGTELMYKIMKAKK